MIKGDKRKCQELQNNLNNHTPQKLKKVTFCTLNGVLLVTNRLMNNWSGHQKQIGDGALGLKSTGDSTEDLFSVSKVVTISSYRPHIW